MDELAKKSPTDIYNSLIEADCNSFLNILKTDEVQLADIANIDVERSKDFIKGVARSIIAHKIRKCDDIPKWIRISTGCPCIDSITNGGIPVRGITEIYGKSGVGKTQFCMQLVLSSQLLNKGSVYICTEDVFPIKRLKELSDIYQKQHGDITFLDNIYIEHISNFEQLEQLFLKLPILLSPAKIGLIVIDSIAGLFRSDNDKTDYRERSKNFDYIALQLQQFSVDYQLATVCVNQVTDNIKSGKAEPCLGLAWSRLVMNRFRIHRLDRSTNVRIFEVVNSPDLESNQCEFIIDKNGIHALS